MRILRVASFALISAVMSTALVGCVNESAFQQSANQFSTSATSLLTAERQILSDLNTAQETFVRDEQELNYIKNSDFDLNFTTGSMPTSSVTSRLAILQEIQLYGEALSNVANGNATKNLDSNTENLVKQLKTTFPKSVGSSADATTVNIAATGVTALGDIILNQWSYHSASEIAAAAQPALVKLQTVFTADAPAIIDTFKTDYSFDPAARVEILTYIRKDKRITAGQLDTAFQSMAARVPLDDLSQEQASIDQLVDSLVKSNAALSANDSASFQNLITVTNSHAKEIETIYSTMNGAKQ